MGLNSVNTGLSQDYIGIHDPFVMSLYALYASGFSHSWSGPIAGKGFALLLKSFVLNLAHLCLMFSRRFSSPLSLLGGLPSNVVTTWCYYVRS